MSNNNTPSKGVTRAQLARDIKEAISELADGRHFPDLMDAVDALAGAPDAANAGEPAAEVLVLLIGHDGDDSPSVAVARNRAELLEQVKVAVWGEPNPADTTNDAGDDMAEGMTDTLLEKGLMAFEGDPPLRLVRIPVDGWFATPTGVAADESTRAPTPIRTNEQLVVGEWYWCWPKGLTDADARRPYRVKTVSGIKYVDAGGMRMWCDPSNDQFLDRYDAWGPIAPPSGEPTGDTK